MYFELAQASRLLLCALQKEQAHLQLRGCTGRQGTEYRVQSLRADVSMLLWGTKGFWHAMCQPSPFVSLCGRLILVYVMEGRRLMMMEMQTSASDGSSQAAALYISQSCCLTLHHPTPDQSLVSASNSSYRASTQTTNFPSHHQIRLQAALLVRQVAQ